MASQPDQQVDPAALKLVAKGLTDTIKIPSTAEKRLTLLGTQVHNGVAGDRT